MTSLDAIETHLELHNIRYAEKLRDELREPAHIRKANIMIRDARWLAPRHKRALVQFPVVLLEDGVGALVGLSFSTDEPQDRNLAPEFRAAVERGVKAAWKLLLPDSPSPPPLLLPRIELDAKFLPRLTGQSVGLAAALAAYGAMTGRKPCRPVVASGEIDQSGALLPADCLGAKLEAVSRESWTDALVVLARRCPENLPASLQVHTATDLEDAVREAYGRNSLSASPGDDFIDGRASREALETLLADGQYERVLELSDSLVSLLRPGMPRLWIQWLAARAAVHLGRPGADECYRRLEKDLRRAVDERDLSFDDWARFVADSSVALIDQMKYSQATARLEETLREGIERRLLTKSVEIHLRGTLAMAWAHQGEYRQAVSQRRKNLELHEHEHGRSTQARTLCNLAWELFLANGSAEESEKLLAEADTRAGGDASQVLYNLYARLRILLWSQKSAQVIAALDEARADSRLREKLQAMAGYPACCIELVRCAALIDTGHLPEGLEGLERLRALHRPAGRPRRGLVGWLVHLGLGWEILAHQEMGDARGMEDKARRARTWLLPESRQCLHRPSARFFSSRWPVPAAAGAVGDTLRRWHRFCWY